MTDKEYLELNLDRQSKNFLEISKKLNSVILRDNGEVDPNYGAALTKFVERTGMAFEILLSTYKMITNADRNADLEPLIRYVDPPILEKLIKDKLPSGLHVNVAYKHGTLDIYITYPMNQSITLSDHLKYYNNTVDSDLGMIEKFFKFNKKFNRNARFGIIGYASIDSEEATFKKWVSDECTAILKPKYPGRDIDVRLLLGDD